MKASHLLPALAALLVICAAVVAGDMYAQHEESLYIHALAPRTSVLKNQGAALQSAALRQPDLLPIYGSSELNIVNPYHGSELFKNYPTGFTISPVGKAGTTDLTILQDLAAVGSELRGKKVAISLSAPWFFVGMADQSWYAGNFSRLHANALAFSTDLSFELKQAAARRMLQYPRTLEGDPVLTFALEKLADGSPISRILYYASLPMGKLQTLVLQLQDHWATLSFIRETNAGDSPLSTEVKREPQTLDWTSLLTSATQQQKQNADNNPFGFDNQGWLKTYRDQVAKQRNAQKDTQFVQTVNQAAEWGDLDLLLRGLKELGAQPLILSMPIQGAYYDYTGVSRQARQDYYNKLEQVAAAYGVRVVDFADHDEDKYFLIDPGAHCSREGWVYYDQALDTFYHGSLQGHDANMD